MKVVISILIASLLVMQTLLPSCDFLPSSVKDKVPGQSSGTPRPGQTSAPSAQSKNAPFTFDYKRTEATVDFFTSNDNIETLFVAGPFYEGSQPLPGQNTASYDQARARKVAEIIKEANTLAQTAARLEPQMAKVRSAYLSYLTAVQKEEPKLNSFVAESFDQVATLATQEQVAAAQYKTIEGSGNNRSLEGSFLNYTKVRNAMELGGLYLQDGRNMWAFSAMVLKATENHPKDAVKKANAQLDKDMQSLDGISKDLAAAAVSMRKIDYGMKQLYTASWQFSKSGNAFMELSLPDIKAKVAALTPKEGLSSEQIEAIRTYLALVERWQAGMKRYTDSADKTKIVFVEPAQEQRWAFLPQKALAAGLADQMVDNYDAGTKTLTVPLAPPDPNVKDNTGYFEKGWNGLRIAGGLFQTGVGLTVDTLGAAAKAASNKYEGNTETWADARKEFDKNYEEAWDNVKKNKPGSKTLKLAKEYFDYAETWTGEQVRDVLTPSDTSSDWKLLPAFAGYHLTRITTGIFTGFGKGVVLVSDRQADAGQLAEGGLEIAFSFIGGSKVIVKGSQVKNLIKPTGSGLELTWNTVNNFCEAAMSEKLRKEITKESAELLSKKLLTKEAAAKLIGNSISLEFREKLLQSLAKSRARMIDEIKQLMTTGKNALVTNIRTVGGSELEQMLFTKFDASLKGVLEAVTKAVGENPTEVLDNIIGEVVDDLIKNIVHTGVDGIVRLASSPTVTPTAKPGPTPTAKPTTPAVNHLAQLQRTAGFKLLIQGRHSYNQDGKVVYTNGINIPSNLDLQTLPIKWDGLNFSFSDTNPRFGPASLTKSTYKEELKGTVSADGNMLVSLEYTVMDYQIRPASVDPRTTLPIPASSQKLDLTIKLKNIPLRYDYVRKGELYREEAQACVVAITHVLTASGEAISSGMRPASKTYSGSDWKNANAGIFLDFK